MGWLIVSQNRHRLRVNFVIVPNARPGTAAKHMHVASSVLALGWCTLTRSARGASQHWTTGLRDCRAVARAAADRVKKARKKEKRKAKAMEEAARREEDEAKAEATAAAHRAEAERRHCEVFIIFV